MYINKMSSDPIYMQIKKSISQKINEGEYKPGDKISSERLLSEEYKVSRMTVRQAVNELVNEGKLYREQGRGTFVSSPRFYQKNLKSFTKTLIENGHVPKTEVLEFSTVYKLDYICDTLDIAKDTKFYKIKRLRFADNIPVALETIYMPQVYCPNLNKYDVSNSVYAILEEQYGYTIDTISCDIDACISDRFHMNLFKVQKKVPLLKVSGINYAKNNLKLFYEESYYRSDLYKYQVDLFKREMDMKK